MTPLKVGILGATGRVGRLLVRATLDAPDLALAAAITRPSSTALGLDAGTLVGLPPCGTAITAVGPDDHLDALDVVIDFSLPEGIAHALPLLAGIPLVSGTTGLDDAQATRLERHAESAPLLVAANFSTGVTLLLDLAERAARALPDYHVEIVETHHRRKRDAPSGTAWALGESVASARQLDLSDVARHGREGQTGERTDSEIGFHALRGGDVVGEHTVWLNGPGERISLGHQATRRETFAFGALRAARWVQGRPPGRYTMADVLALT